MFNAVCRTPPHPRQPKPGRHVNGECGSNNLLSLALCILVVL